MTQFTAIEYGTLRLLVPEGHPLYQYQIKYPYYDRLLPKVARHICEGFQDSIVIDIGANIGDTAIQILAEAPNVSVLAVEPHPDFVRILWKNILHNQLLDRCMLETSIIMRHAEKVNIVRSGSGFTGEIDASLKAGQRSRAAQSKTMLDLVTKTISQPQNIRLIKIDTDGYDAEILLSITEAMRRLPILKPVGIWFEFQPYLNDLGLNDPNLQTRVNTYEEAMHELCCFGYSVFAVIDNFGVPILSMF